MVLHVVVVLEVAVRVVRVLLVVREELLLVEVTTEDCTGVGDAETERVDKVVED